MKFKVAIIPASILIGGFLIMLLLLNLKPEEEQKKNVVQKKIVQTIHVELGEITTTIEAFGKLKSSQPVSIYSEVSGEILKGQIPFQPAQSFKKGDLLLKIDDRQLLFEINSLKSDFLTALAQLLPEIKVDFPDQFKKWEMYFNQFSFEKKLDPFPEKPNPKIKMYLSRFNIYKLFYSIRNLEVRLEKHFIYAPFDGSIVSADSREGTIARVGSKLGEIINLENLEVEVPVKIGEISWIDKNTPVEFTSAEINGAWKGRIIRVGKTIDEQTQTVPVFVSLNKTDSNHLFAGTFFTAHITGKSIANAFRVPRKSVYNKNYVYIVEDEHLKYKSVEISREEKDFVIVTGGLHSGDKLVTEILQGVSDGMPASARTADLTGGEI